MSRGGMVNRSWSSTVTSARMPGSSRPATSSEWFTHADAGGEGVDRGVHGDRLVGQERVHALRHPRPPEPLGQHPVHRHVDLLQRVGAGHRPVAAERDPRSLPQQRADLVLPGGRAPARRTGGSAPPSGSPRTPTAAGSWPPRRARRTAPMSRGVMNCRWARWCRAARRCVGRQRREGVERGADREVADGVEVQLEPGRAQPPHRLGQLFGLDEQAPGMVRGMPGPVQVRSGHRGGERLAHAVEHQLDRGRPEPALRRLLAPGQQVVDLAEAAVAVPPQGADHMAV